MEMPNSVDSPYANKGDTYAANPASPLGRPLGTSDNPPVEHTMEKLVVFSDYANIAAGYENQGVTPDHRDLLAYLSEGRFLVEAHAFVPIDPRNPTGRDAAIEDLWEARYLVHTKTGMAVGDSYRCDLDVEITLEMMRAAEVIKPDIMVLISGDKDFIPLILELRRRGVRVEVAALPGVNAAREMMQKASGFIDLSMYQRERDVAYTASSLAGDARDECAWDHVEL